jgi:hypothetical protein
MTWEKDEWGAFVDPPPPPYHCRQCGGLLEWQRTPMLPAPAGIWIHEQKPADRHAVVVPWAGA